MPIKNIFSIDVEEYYHVIDDFVVPTPEKWDALPSRVENNFHELLDLLDKWNTKATCFFLGYVAQKHPDLVKEAHDRGHEIASHGMYHELVTSLTRERFLNDIQSSKKLLEDLIGHPVVGYRAPAFSVLNENKTFFPDLAQSGYRFDSSIFPAKRDFGGYTTDNLAPFQIKTEFGTVTEFPITVVNLFHKRLCVFGGGFLRLFPMPMIDVLSKKVNKENRPVVYYIHPREIDPDHPRMNLTRMRYFKSYVNLKTTYPKLNAILKTKNCGTFTMYMNDKGLNHE
ncbi:MAG TPA: polysaccharide deacetylase family protein [Candidatus Cloacimonadota bacterium]|nr:polysaccharide deacetylase family protein [Candidatus Cloacimonadota bacterium]HPT72316.1 polysaccharide deacetylase family protein [Candidatus Cloacimonadota bacterium]